MGRKFLIFIVIIIILIGGVYYLYHKNQALAPSQDLNTPDQQATTAPSQSQIEPPVTPSTIQNNTSLQTTTGGGEQSIDGNNIQVVEVDFDGSKFTPATTNINSGDWVFFKNKSSAAFWPASDPYSANNGYPGFDALKPIAAGGEYKFQFNKAGTWGYHDNLNHSITGTIIVAKLLPKS